MRGLDGPVVNEEERGGTDEFGVDLKVFHHFEERLKRLMCGVVGVEFG